MGLLHTTALSVALAVTIGLVNPAAADAQRKKAEEPQQQKISLSKAFNPLAVEIQKLVDAKDFANAKLKIGEAAASLSKPDDTYFMGNLTLNVGLGLKEEAMQRRGLEMMLESGMTPAADAPKFHYYVGQFAINAKDFPGARHHLGQALAGNYGGALTEVYLANSYFSEAQAHITNNQYSDAGKALVQQGLPHLRKAIEVQKASGQAVDASWYNKGLVMAVFGKDPAALDWMKLALAGSGTPDNWRLVLRELQNSNSNLGREENLDILRLMAASKALQNAYSYNEYAETANRVGLPGEVKAIIDAGRASGEIEKTMLADIYQVANATMAKDKASLAASEKSAGAAANGRLAVNTGNAFLGYGDNAKAIALYRLALDKGGVDADEVNTRLGIALQRSGDSAGALEAFGKVGGTGLRKTIAELWAVWVRSQTA
jgi:hypothetical protein